MDLYSVRHAVAHERDADRWPDDAKRPLTPEGEKRFRLAAGGILRLVPEVDYVLSSPFVWAYGKDTGTKGLAHAPYLRGAGAYLPATKV